LRQWAVNHRYDAREKSVPAAVIINGINKMKKWRI